MADVKHLAHVFFAFTSSHRSDTRGARHAFGVSPFSADHNYRGLAWVLHS